MTKYLPKQIGKGITLSCCIGGLLLSTAAHVKAQNLHSGNVVVLQVGDGTVTPSNASTNLFLTEFNTVDSNQTIPTASVAIPDTGANRLTNSGSATSEGQINLSTDGNLIVIAGYDTSAGMSGVANSASSVVKRAIDTVNRFGAVGRAATTTVYSGNNLRSAARAATDDYWGAGGNSGTYYFGNTAAPDSVQYTYNNLRVVRIFNDTLYFSSGSGTHGIYKVYSTTTGLPTNRTNVTAGILVPTGSSSSPYAFVFDPTGDTLYYADDRTNSAGGVQKWVNNGGTWAVADTLTVGTGAGARGLVADFSGTYPVLYATTTTNKLVKIIDSGNIASNTYVTLATAPNNVSYRSVSFAPICNDGTPAADSIVADMTSDSSFNFSVANASHVSTYYWMFGDGNTDTASAPAHIYLGNGTYTVKAVLTNQCGVTDTLSTSVTISVCHDAVPTADSIIATMLTDSSYSFSVANASHVNTYNWMFGDGNSDTATAPSHVYTTNGTYTVQVVLTNMCGVTDTLSKDIQIAMCTDSVPSADSIIATMVTDSSYNFSVANATHVNTSYWMFGDGNSDTATAPSHTYSSSGTYTVQVVLTNLCGITDTLSKDVQISICNDAMPTADSIAVTTTSDSSYNFSVANASHANTYSWTFGDGGTATTATASHAYTADGPFTVQVVLTNQCGMTDTLTTIVNPSVGIENINGNASAINLYPNPANNTLYVNAKGNLSINEVRILNSVGQTVTVKKGAAAKTFALPVNNIPAGLYIVTIQTDKGVITEKIQIVH